MNGTLPRAVPALPRLESLKRLAGALARMARGYPEPKEDVYPVIENLLPEGVCIICKRRPSREGDSKCAECAAILAA